MATAIVLRCDGRALRATDSMMSLGQGPRLLKAYNLQTAFGFYSKCTGKSSWDFFLFFLATLSSLTTGPPGNSPTWDFF